MGEDGILLIYRFCVTHARERCFAMISAAWPARSRFVFCSIIGFEVALAMGEFNRCRSTLARAENSLGKLLAGHFEA
jgi:hypothetical protein